jgi:hypothetical protein
VTGQSKLLEASVGVGSRFINPIDGRSSKVNDHRNQTKHLAPKNPLGHPFPTSTASLSDDTVLVVSGIRLFGVALERVGRPIQIFGHRCTLSLEKVARVESYENFQSSSSRSAMP